ncbi:DNA methyltransferase [Streptococcus suis]|uniref:Putative type III restriction/modification system modification methylase n=1 Tax=Streptococcus suis TaxID=1307 RepID=A0A0Z8FRW7_STRSU|nr:site-specific DNA-methyltransferase [Streptococcus suis]MCK4003796.1 site-specific DNA-methyltransferase [Streptococcus suis]NQH30571.1 site-specific DNA-methyltransferase [Streptococcus suis]NQH47892.1 site-specific DNA-methyltransferase [Streptococcus suis]NQH68599.1 site-specific DNA-methyltransferase [Streptococcus suis]NQH92942.1 site-specific DNA-methyltransferase [Streptococcus suis]
MKQELEQLLAQNDTFMVEGVLNKNKLAELARQYNPELLNILMSNDKISNHFFSILDTGVLVFKKDVFLQFLNNKEFLPDSFTAYKTKIGLAIGDKYLSENQEVVLNFPYKDCVLEGGQTKDDAKRQEIFFNETLAPTEINRLLDDKVLTNFKRYDETGEHEVEVLNDTDNLIIKGNNLIALHSLKKRFAGKIKLIYIDPPYNTGNDSFQYNDNFNHSTWLTFMKNRLEVARELLSEDGLIFVHLDYNEAHYFKVLMDSIFGQDKFVNEIIWRRKQATSFGKSKFGITNDTIFMYSKTSSYKFFPIYTLDDENTQKYIKERFKFDDNDGRGKYMKSPLVNSLYRPNLKYEFYGIKPPKNGWLYSKERMQELYDNGEIIVPEDKNARLYRKIFLSEYKGQVVQNIWLDIPIVNPMAKEQVDFSTQKPENLLKRIIECCTVENDIVLDYHLGSGTTAAVAHKMNRQYIGIEQMDYIETVSVERLKKVIAGEQGGISKDVNWSGGGSFVYAELKNDAQDFKNAIFEATTTEELLELFELAKKSSFLSYRIDPKKLKKNEFEKFSLAEQKQILSEIIDNNNLYVNYSDIDDSDFQISAEDKKLNHAFYGKEK